MTDPAHIAELTGWTPYGSTWPPDGAAVDMLHPDGTVSEGVRYEHAGMWLWPPPGGRLRRDIVGWRLFHLRVPTACMDSFGGGELTGGAKQMDVQPLEVYATDSNYAVVKPPGRQFPGAVMQGDSLRQLCGLAVGIAKLFRDSGPTDDPEVLGGVQELTELLVGRLLHYQRVLVAHGIELPYTRPVTEEDMVQLLPDQADAEPSAAPDPAT
jgi:hypothetical protein